MTTLRILRSGIPLAALLAPAASSGQSLALPVGTRVRVEAPALFTGRVVGTVMARADDSLVVAVMARRAGQDTGAVRRYVLTRALMPRLEISNDGRRSTAALRGAKVGVALGGAFLLYALATSYGTGWEPVAAHIGGIATGASALTGALIGSVFTLETWDPVFP